MPEHVLHAIALQQHLNAPEAEQQLYRLPCVIEPPPGMDRDHMLALVDTNRRDAVCYAISDDSFKRAFGFYPEDIIGEDQ